MQILVQCNDSSQLLSKKSIFSVFVFPVSQLLKIVQTWRWKSKSILVCYCRLGFLNLQGWGLVFPFLLHRNFIRLLLIDFSYLLQVQLLILLKNVFLKKCSTHTIRQSREIVNLKARLWKIYAVAYPWPSMGISFFEKQKW